MALNKRSDTSVLTVGGDGYLQHIEKLRERAKLFREADQLEDDADFYDDLVTLAALQSPVEDDNDSVDSLREQATNARKKAAELVRNILDVSQINEYCVLLCTNAEWSS